MDSIRIKRGMRAELPSSLPLGELAFCIDTRELWVGSGDGLALKRVTNTEVTELLEHWHEIYTEHDERFQTKYVEVSEQFASKYNALSTQFADKFHELSVQFADKSDALDTQFEQQYTKLTDKFETKYASLESDYAQDIFGLKTQATNQTEEIEQLKRDIGTTANIEQLVEINNQATETLTELREIKNGIEEDVLILPELQRNVEGAKTDFRGKEHDNLHDRIVADVQELHDTIHDTNYLEQRGESVFLDSSLQGMTRDMSIKGHTKYNAIVDDTTKGETLVPYTSEPTSNVTIEDAKTRNNLPSAYLKMKGLTLHNLIKEEINATTPQSFPTINGNSSGTKNFDADTFVNNQNICPLIEGETLINRIISDNCVQTQNIYQTFETETTPNVTIDATFSHGQLQPQLEGKTLINLQPKSTWTIQSNGTIINYNTHMLTRKMKPNTKYLVKLVDMPQQIKRVYFSPNSDNSGIKTLTNGCAIFTTSSNLNMSLLHMYSDVPMTDNAEAVAKCKPLIIEYEEGMENWQLPYFTGAISVNVSQVKATNKNLLTSDVIDALCTLENWEGTELYRNNYVAYDLLGLKPNVNYEINTPALTIPPHTYPILFLDRKSNSGKPGSLLKSGWYNNNTSEPMEIGATTDWHQCPDMGYFRAYLPFTEEGMNKLRTILNTSGFAIVEGTNVLTGDLTSSSSYIRPNEKITLRNVNNLYVDTYNPITQKYYKTTIEYTLDGSEDWVYEGNGKFSVNNLELGQTGTYGSPLYATCDTLIPCNYATWVNAEELQPYSLLVADDGFKVYKPSDSNVESFKNWLSQFPVTVVSRLLEPIEVEVGTQGSLKTYDTKTHLVVSSDNGICPKVVAKNLVYETVPLEPNTEYTVHFRLNALDHSSSEPITFNVGGAVAQYSRNDYCVKITTPSNIVSDTIEVTGRRDAIGGIVLLQGDTLGYRVPVFKGEIHSENPYLKVTNGNLVKPSDFVQKATLFNKHYNFKTDNYLTDNARGIGMVRPVKISPNKSYRITYDSTNDRALHVFKYHLDGTHIVGDHGSIKSGGVFSHSQAHYITFYPVSGSLVGNATDEENRAEFEKIANSMCIREVGDNDSVYTNTQREMKPSSNIVLRSINNVVRDSYDPRTGEYIQRVGVMRVSSQHPDFKHYRIANHQNYRDMQGIDVAFNKPLFKKNTRNICGLHVSGHNTGVPTRRPNVRLHEQSILVFCMPPKEDGTRPTLDEMTAWFEENEIIIYYELAEPIVKTINPNNRTLTVYTPNTHITVDTNKVLSSLPIVSYKPLTYTALSSKLKTNDTYTLVFDAYTNLNNRVLSVNAFGGYLFDVALEKDKRTKVVKTFSMPSAHIYHNTVTFDGYGIGIRNVQVFEGDRTVEIEQNQIKYVRGIQSVSDDSTTLKVRVISKNLWSNNPNDQVYDSQPDSKGNPNTAKGTVIQSDGTVIANGNTVSTGGKGLLLHVKPNTTYVFGATQIAYGTSSSGGNRAFALNVCTTHGINQRLVYLDGNQLNVPRVFTYTTKPDEHWVVLAVVTSGGTGAVARDVFFYEVINGDNSSEYEAQQRHTHTINLPVTYGLKSLPNGVCDEITPDGKLIQRVGRQVLNRGHVKAIYTGRGEESTTVNTVAFRLADFDHNPKWEATGIKGNTLCNLFPSSSFNATISPHYEDVEAIGMDTKNTNTTNAFTLRINKDRLSANTVDAFKEWLDNNEVVVYYPLDTPIEHDLGINLKVKTFNSDAQIYTDTLNIKPSIELVPLTYHARIIFNTKYLVHVNTRNQKTDLHLDLGGATGVIPVGENSCVITTPDYSNISSTLKITGAGNILQGVSVQIYSDASDPVCLPQLHSVGDTYNAIKVYSCGTNLAKYINAESEIVRGVKFICNNGVVTMEGGNTGYVGYDLATGKASDKIECHTNTPSLLNYYSDKRLVNEAGVYVLSGRLFHQMGLEIGRITVSLGVVYDDTKYEHFAPYPDAEGNLTFSGDKTFRVTSHINGICIGVWYSGFNVNTVKIDQIQLTRSSSKLPFEEYKEHQITIPLPIEDGLKSLPNGVADEITPDGKLIQRVGKFHIENCDPYNEKRSNVVYYYSDSIDDASSNYKYGRNVNNVFCNNLPRNAKIHHRDAIGIAFFIDGVDTFRHFRFGIDIRDLEPYGLVNGNVTSHKTCGSQWLRDNPTYVYYELEEPIVHDLFVGSPNLRTVQGMTLVNTTELVKPNLTFKAPMDVNAVISNLKAEKSALQNEVTDYKLAIQQLSYDYDVQSVELENLKTSASEIMKLNQELMNDQQCTNTKQVLLENQTSKEVKALQKSAEEIKSDLNDAQTSLTHGQEMLELGQEELHQEQERTKIEQQVQDQQILSSMLASTEIFELVLAVMPMQLGDERQSTEGGSKMVEVYVTLIIAGEKTLEQVPALVRPKVEAQLKAMGVLA